MTESQPSDTDGIRDSGSVSGRLVSQLPYCDVGEALAAYAKPESEHDDPNMEIVLVGADSIETVMRTHAQYFPRGSEFDSP